MKYEAIPWVQGNPLKLRIPLEKVIITPSGKETEDYYVQETDAVAVRLKSLKKTYEYRPEIDGNIAIITDKSKLAAGSYAVEVMVKEAGGTIRRSYYPQVIQVVQSTPEMLDAFDDFPVTEGIVLDTPGIFFQCGSSVSWDEVTDKPDFAEVATTGNYTDLQDKPMINGVTLMGDKSMEDLGVDSITNMAIQDIFNRVFN